MAKKNKQQQTISPKEYIKSKARSLPIGKCYINKNWEEACEAVVVVNRNHKQGTFTTGIYLVDIACKGLVNSVYYFSVSDYELKNILERFPDGLISCSYEEAHNVIYGAIAFAEEGGIGPDSSFAITQYILEEDTEDIPLIEYEFGHNGQHFLLANSMSELSHYLPKLKSALGDNFKYSVKSDSFGDDLSDDFDDDVDEDTLRFSRPPIYKDVPMEEYSFVYEKGYPINIQLNFPQLQSLLYDADNGPILSPDRIDEILSLEHEKLREDIENIILYETGCICKDISEERWKSPCNFVIFHSLIILGEIGNPASLPTVMLTLCQNQDYFESNFGDYADEVYQSTLYKLGKDDLDSFTQYFHTPGLYGHARITVLSAVASIALRNPERRDEIIGWFRNLCEFYLENISRRHCCDGNVAAMMVGNLIDLNASELLPEIESLYATGLMDKFCCGDFQDVKEELANLNDGFRLCPLEIHERYREMPRPVIKTKNVSD